MSPTLVIDFPNDLRAEMLLERERIPCVLNVRSWEPTTIAFTAPLLEAVGHVENFDSTKLVKRVPIMAGGSSICHSHGLVTLRRISARQYDVLFLSVFVRGYPGWCPLIDNGEWATPVQLMTPDALQMLAQYAEEPVPLLKPLVD